MATLRAGGRRTPFFVLVGVFLLLVNVGLAQAPQTLPHLEAARQLVRDLQDGARVNEYGSSPTFLRWGHPTREARTVCATFITRLLEHTYALKKDDIKDWLGTNGADASEWYQTISKEDGFWRLSNVKDIHPGDFLAIKYNDGSKDTGHIMVVDQSPKRIKATAPIEPETTQYRVLVIDSSASGHGPGDTRHKPDGGFTGGIGRGTIRLYADHDGKIAGYAWSETAKSEYYHAPTRDLVAGRLIRFNEDH